MFLNPMSNSPLKKLLMTVPSHFILSLRPNSNSLTVHFLNFVSESSYTWECKRGNLPLWKAKSVLVETFVFYPSLPCWCRREVRWLSRCFCTTSFNFLISVYIRCSLLVNLYRCLEYGQAFGKAFCRCFIWLIRMWLILDLVDAKSFLYSF